MAANKPKKSGPHHINLMLNDALFGKLSALAQRGHFTVSNQLRLILVEHLEGRETRALDHIRQDMEIVWARFSARFTRLELEEQILDALADAKNLDDLTRIKKLTRASQAIRDDSERRERAHLNKERVSS
jgi:hypothetical protein